MSNSIIHFVRNAIFCLLIAAGVLLPRPGIALAEPLDDAKARGQLGELQTGYLGAVVTPLPPDVQALMNDVNQKRKEKYFEIAKKNGTAVSAVEALAAKKAIDSTPAGQFVQLPSGAWSKK